MDNEKKSVLGAACLVSGCCIGAGMLGLPLVTLSSGFLFSLIPLFAVWAYMYLSGLMLLEVYLSKKQNVNLMTLLKETLGVKAKVVGCGLFLFLFYSILTAYLSASSIMLKDATNHFFSIELPSALSLIISACILYLIVLLRIQKIDYLNRILVGLMLTFYLCLVITGLPQVSFSHLMHTSHASSLVWTIPVFIVSFGFQNLVPTVSYYLGYNTKRIKSALFYGTLATLVIYVLWNGIVLGILSNKTIDPNASTTTLLRTLFGQSATKVGFFINGFSVFAIVTSLLSVSLSFVNFLSDSSDTHQSRVFYASLVMLPPTLFALINPDVFLLALRLAGGIGAVCLFGMFPALMLWKMRSRQKEPHSRVFPFGKTALMIYLFLSIGILMTEIANLALTK